MGSMGEPGDAETSGGGRMVIISDSIIFNGASVQANAKPYADSYNKNYYLVGGSGGYIYIQTTNNLNENKLGSNVTIEAMGGIGTNGNYGGSGGVIVFDGGFSALP
jgi:hypothetical protein